MPPILLLKSMLRNTSSRAHRSGAPLDRGPRPLQSCMIITAGKGPGPSGLNSVTGIRSTAPFGAVVVMDREVAPMQPPRNKDKESVSSVDVRIALPVKEITGKYSSQNITDSKNHNCPRFNFVGGELSINFRPRSSQYSRGTYDDFPACC